MNKLLKKEILYSVIFIITFVVWTLSHIIPFGFREAIRLSMSAFVNLIELAFLYFCLYALINFFMNRKHKESGRKK